eukprot:EG_transcript_40895
MSVLDHHGSESVRVREADRLRPSGDVLRRTRSLGEREGLRLRLWLGLRRGLGLRDADGDDGPPRWPDLRPKSVAGLASRPEDPAELGVGDGLRRRGASGL